MPAGRVLRRDFFIARAVDGTSRQRQCIESQQYTDKSTLEELHAGGLESRRVAQQHGADEAYGAPYADGRECLHGVEPVLFQDAVGYGVGECDGRHVECDAERIECEQRTELHVAAGRKGIVACGAHEKGGEQVADAQQPLGRNPPVGDDADDGGHEERNDSLHGVEDADVRRQSDAHQVGTHRGQIGAPHGVLQEIHENKAEFDAHRYSVLSVCPEVAGRGRSAARRGRRVEQI